MLKRCKRRHHEREQRCALRGCKEVSQFLSISNKSILTYPSVCQARERLLVFRLTEELDIVDFAVSSWSGFFLV